MAFTSLAFASFFAVTLAAYYLCPPRHRWAVVLAASLYFYAFASSGAVHLAVLAGLTLVSYLAAIAIERARTPGARRAWLLAAIVPVIVALVGFRAGAGLFPDLPLLAVPLGLSFFALRLVAYAADVYRGRSHAERHAGRFAAYAAFFPELPAGPIDRAQALLPQLQAPTGARCELLASGATRFAWGLFKKLVVADRLRHFVAAVYDVPAGERFPDGAWCAIATLFFAVQIYCDFSGYSDMAIGAGEMLGLRLTPNFDRPYGARSVAEFWTRWHISFSTWLRDYVFLPLVYRADRILDGRLSAGAAEKAGYAVASLTTMALCGLWHGASWTFLAWGLVMGAFLTGSVLTRRWRGRIARRLYAGRLRPARDTIRTLITFSLVCLSWVFFRANSIGDAFRILAAIPGGLASWATQAAAAAAAGKLLGAGLAAPIFLGRNTYDVVVALGSIALLALVERLQASGSLRQLLEARPFWVRWPLYAALVLAILAFRVPAATTFIYAGF